MLVHVFPKIKDILPVKLLRGFFSSSFYLLLIGLLMTLGELLAIELAVFWCDLLLSMVALLFADDTRAVIPVACCGYMTIAAPNNPIFARQEGRETVFHEKTFQIQLFFILLVAVILLAARLVMLFIEDPHRAGAPKLAAGFLFLGVAYMLGGGASSHYSSRTALFGFVQIASLAFFYLYFHFAVDQKSLPKEYIPTLFLVIGVMISVQVFGMYRGQGVFLSDGSVYRGALYVGWGTYNNIGGIMAMTIPAPFYFAVKQKHGYPFVFVAAYLLFSTFLTQSRGSILFGTVTFILCVFWTLSATKGRSKRDLFIVYLAIVTLIFILLIVWRERIAKLFASVIEAGTDDSNRFTIWKNCFAVFKKNPIFGVGFYDTPGFGFEYNVDHSAFIPARAHNTYLQLVATGGIVLVIAYLFHRFETLRLLLTKRSTEKYFALFVVAALLLTSLVDCHFFNIGPGILYGVVLFFAEATEAAGPPKGKDGALKRLAFRM